MALEHFLNLEQHQLHLCLALPSVPLPRQVLPGFLLNHHLAHLDPLLYPLALRQLALPLVVFLE